MSRADPGASSISVTVRVRPFTIREAAQLAPTDEANLFLGDGSLAGVPAPKLNQRGLRSVIKVMDERCLVFDPPEDNPVQKFSRSVVPKGKKVKDQVFAFDRVFDDNASQVDIYEATTKNLLDSVLDGYNATVFAYGATGCGKTHTITGTAQQPGIIFMTMQELFEKIQERSGEKATEVSLSYLEIYNETIRDLLVPGGSKQGLMLREDSNQAVTVAGLTSHHPKDVQEVMDMIVQGNEFRTVSPTAANAVSSRSHAVLQINIAQKDRNADVNEPHTMATLSIIDLAGSERASATQNRGERLLEGANINKSLLALGSCINALCDPRKKNHIPYRNSKLTRLLKFSLGGNCKTVMIVCVSPSSAHFDETQNTLRYANRAKNIQTKVTRNVFNVNRHVKDFLVKIDEQMALITELRAQQKDAEKTFFAKFRKQMEKQNCTVREGTMRLRAAYDNSATERQEKITNMKKLRSFERRVGLLSAWIASFDAVCDMRNGEDTMPGNLTAMRKTAHGILIELEHSRQHIHQKLERSNWERGLDTAYQHSLQQLQGTDGDGGEQDTLAREVELLKSNFMRDAHREVLDFDKSGDAALVQVLLTAQIDILSSLSETLAMSEDEAVAHAKSIINRLLDVGMTAAGNVIKPDGSLPMMDKAAPVKRGTPKKKRLSMSVERPSQMPTLSSIPAAIQQQAFASPMKNSPRRRKAGTARKSVSFTPVRRKSDARRGVRWRDDETEGTLADFARTPQKFDATPDHSTFKKSASPVPPTASYLNQTEGDQALDASPSLPAQPSAQFAIRPSRFQAGFLSKTRKSELGTVNGSPVPPTLSLSLASSSDNETSPLRSIPVSRAANSRLSPRNFSPKPQTLTTLDENEPPKRSPSASTNGVGSGSDSETIDENRLRTALHSAKRQHRVSVMAGTTASAAKARRVSSIDSTHRVVSHRASASYSGPLASSTNGISRHRRGSNGGRRSPPITCSPPPGNEASSGGPLRPFTAGQARRMNMGGSVRLDSLGSPQAEREREPSGGASRRVTIGGAQTVGSGAGRGTKTGVVWR